MQKHKSKRFVLNLYGIGRANMQPSVWSKIEHAENRIYRTHKKCGNVKRGNEVKEAKSAKNEQNAANK